MLSLVGHPVHRKPRPISGHPGRLRRVRSDTAANFLRRLNNVQIGGESTTEDVIHGHTNSTASLHTDRVGSGLLGNVLPPQRHLLEIVVSREREQFIENLKKKGGNVKCGSDGQKPNELSPEHVLNPLNQDAHLQKTNWSKGHAQSVLQCELSNSANGQSHSNGCTESMEVPDRGHSGSSSKLSGDKTPDSDPNAQWTSVKPRKTSGGKKKKKISASIEEEPKFTNTTVLADIAKKPDASVSNKKKFIAKTSKLDIPIGCCQEMQEPENMSFLTPARELADSSSGKLEKYSPRAGRNGRESLGRKDVHVTHATDQIVIQAKSCRAQQQSPGNRSKSSMDSPRDQDRSPKLRKNALSQSHGQIDKHNDTTEKEKVKPNSSSSKVKSMSSPAKSTSPAAKSKLSPSASQYINRLMQEADEEIRELTTELEEDVKRERKLVKNLRQEVEGFQTKEVREECNVSGGSVGSQPAPGDDDTNSDWAGEHLQVPEDTHWNALQLGSAVMNDTIPRKESFSRSKSGKSSKRELVGAAPTKISLMISNDNVDPRTEQQPGGSRNFLPASRQNRPVYLRHNTKKN